jgi:hypothetical protein
MKNIGPSRHLAQLLAPKIGANGREGPMFFMAKKVELDFSLFFYKNQNYISNSCKNNFEKPKNTKKNKWLSSSFN